MSRHSPHPKPPLAVQSQKSVGQGPIGADLQDFREAAGLIQTDLAGCRRGAVAYWERKQRLDIHSSLVGRFARIVGMYDYETSIAGARAHARWGVTQAADLPAQLGAAQLVQLAALEAQILAQETRRREGELQRQAAREARQQLRRRSEREVHHAQPEPTRCGALTRRGAACRHAVEPGRARCKFHGGLSTGARTPEGRTRISEAQQRRWTAWRLARAKEGDTLARP